MNKKLALVVVLMGALGVSAAQAADVTIFADIGGDVTSWDQAISAGDQFYVKFTTISPLSEVYGYMLQIDYDTAALTAVDSDLANDTESGWDGTLTDSFGGDDYTTYLDGEPVIIDDVAGQAIVSVAVTLPADAQPTYFWAHTIAQVAFTADAAATSADAAITSLGLNDLRGGIVGDLGGAPGEATAEFLKNCGLRADMNNDLIVEWADFGMFASQWQSTGQALLSDYNYDEVVEWADFGTFAGQWQTSCD